MTIAVTTVDPAPRAGKGFMPFHKGGADCNGFARHNQR